MNLIQLPVSYLIMKKRSRYGCLCLNNEPGGIYYMVIIAMDADHDTFVFAMPDDHSMAVFVTSGALIWLPLSYLMILIRLRLP